MANKKELGENHRVRIRPKCKTYKLDYDRCNEMIKVNPICSYLLMGITLLVLDMLFFLSCPIFQANPKLQEFRYKPLQLKEELENLFTNNSSTGKNAWALAGDNL